MPQLIIFIDKDPQAIWEDLQKNGQVNKSLLINQLQNLVFFSLFKRTAKFIH